MQKTEPDLDRILSRLDVGDCWEWKLSLDKDGYGKSHTGSRAQGTKKYVHVHRYIYETLCDVELGDMTLDHLCKNRKCANPDHLQPVTRSENVRRGFRPKLLRCVHGHSFANAYITKAGTRECRYCRAEHGRIQRLKRRAVA